VNARPARILLVDDDAGSRHLVERILTEPGCRFSFNVDFADDSAAAVERLGSERFDGVVVNTAPGANPTDEVAEEIHARWPEVPVIALKTPCDSGGEGDIAAPLDLAERLSQAIADSRAMRALKQSCKTFKSIVHYAPDIIICTTPAGRILLFNAAARRLWNRGRSDVIGKNFLDTCFSPDERPGIRTAIQNISQGQPVADIQTVVGDDKIRKTLVWRFSSIYSDGDAVPVIIAVAHEAATQAQAQEDKCHVGFKPEFNDTVDLVLSSLCAIIERIDRINDTATPQVLDRLRRSYGHLPATARQIPAEKARAVERLVLSLITQGQKQAS